jgi:hypothetical protein
MDDLFPPGALVLLVRKVVDASSVWRRLTG